MITGIVLLGLGIIQIIWMVWAIRTDAASNRVSLIEAAILKAGDAEPLPKSRLGLALDRILLWLGLLLGSAMSAVGLIFLVLG